MHKKLLYSILSGLLSSNLFALEVVIIEEDFEDATDVIVPAGAGQLTSTTVTDPEVGGTRGQVKEIALDGTAVWGALDTDPLRIPLLPLGISPGTDTFEFTADIFIPSTTALLAPDTTGIRIRWTDELESARSEISSQQNVDNYPRDEWVTFTLNGNIPATFGGDNEPTTHIRPIISTFDNADADPGNRANGTVIYLDNIKIIANTSGEDPNIVSADLSPFGVLETGGVVTRSHPITNSGVNNDLIIADTSSITGTDAAHYAITTPLPLTIPPGTSANIDLTFDSSVGAGSYSATLNIESNDLADPATTLSLSALVTDPTGSDLIINGSFETGNILGFRAVQANALEILSAPADPVHSGNHAAVFTLPGGNQWNAFELDQTSPPAAEGFPNRIEITDRMIGQPYKFSCWYFKPSVDGLADDDRAQMIIRWNGIFPDSGPFTSLSGADLPADTWVEYTEEGFVPTNWPEEPTGAAVDSAYLIFSIKDEGGNSPGTQIYIDDLQFTVELSDPPVEEVYPEMISIDRDPTSGYASITWTSAPDQTYRLEYSVDLQAWLEIDDEYTAELDSDTTTWTDTSAAGVDVRYYRVHLNLPPPPAE